MNDEYDDNDTLPEDLVAFVGPCACDHDEEQHGWGECGVEGCECQAGWEE